MDKLFVSYKHSGIDPQLLIQELSLIKKTVSPFFNQVYCSFFDDRIDESMKREDILNLCVGEMRTSSDILYFVGKRDELFATGRENKEYSEGMSIEAKKNKILRIPSFLFTPSQYDPIFFRNDVQDFRQYSDMNDLVEKLHMIYSYKLGISSKKARLC